MARIVFAWGMTVQESPEAVPVVREVVERLALPEEWLRWNALMHEHHYLGFKQFAGRGLRYVAEWNGQWLAAGLADGSVSVPAARPVAGLAEGGPVTALAPLRKFALFDPATGAGAEEPGLAGTGVEPAAAERGLIGALGALARVGRDIGIKLKF